MTEFELLKLFSAIITLFLCVILLKLSGLLDIGKDKKKGDCDDV